jgi:hypothetical protein
VSEEWIATRTLIARTKKANPEADTSELLDQMRRQKAESDILRIADQIGLTAEERARIAEMLLASVDG